MGKVIKNIALVAHDNMKPTLMEWVKLNGHILTKHHLICTGTTGRYIKQTLNEAASEEGDLKLNITILKSGPIGGDQQLGAMITEQKVDMVIFFWDPMEPQPHDVDVKALLRICVLYNLPTASNLSTADFLISSELFETPYVPKPINMDEYLNRTIQIK